jgi:archaellum biogenesis ATPase FlaH
VFTCIQSAFNEGAIPGSRHKKILRIASVWQRQGIPLGAAIAALQAWAPDLGAKAIQIQVEKCYKQQYGYGCNDEVMKKYCDPRCIFYANKDSATAKVDAKQMEADFVKYVHSDYTKDSMNLAQIFHLDDDFWIFPGEFDVVWGDTGVGKSAFTQYLLSKTKLKTLVLSLENHQHLFFRRQIQIAHNMSKAEVISHYEHHHNTLSNAINHIKVITTSPALGNLRRIITEENPKLVVVDTLDGVIVEGVKDETQAGIRIANTLKQLAQAMSIIILGVHHISKHAAQDEDGKMRVLTIHSGKGSSSIEQKADKVIGIEGDRAGEFRRIRVLKARDETPFLIQARQDKSTFVFHQILAKEGKQWPVQPENTQQMI